MVTFNHTARRRSVTGFAGGFALAMAACAMGLGAAAAQADVPRSPSEPCVPGIWIYNPYVVNCGLPQRGNRVLGQAPDAGALIACRGNKQCLSLYVNGGYGWYPGATLTPGYHP